MWAFPCDKTPQDICPPTSRVLCTSLVSSLKKGYQHPRTDLDESHEVDSRIETFDI